MASKTKAASRGKETAKNSIVNRKFLERLAESFRATNWGGSEKAVMNPDDVMSFLDITPEQVVLLCATGFLKGVPMRGDEVGVPVADLIRFMEEHGEWWFALRCRKQLERLDPVRLAIRRAANQREGLLALSSALRDLKESVDAKTH